MPRSKSCAVPRSWPPIMDCPRRLPAGVGRSVRPTISVRPRMRIANKPAVWRNRRTILLLHRLEEADRRLEQALALDPWLAYAWIRRGWMSAYFGDGDGAIRELRIALHLMPFEPLRHITCIGMGCAHFAAERYDRAAKWIKGGVEAYPESHWAQRIAVAAVALTGARAEARRMGRQLIRKDPGLT